MNTRKRLSNIRNRYFRLFGPKVVPWSQLTIGEGYTIAKMPYNRLGFAAGDRVYIGKRTREEITLIKIYTGKPIKKESLDLDSSLYYPKGTCSLVRGRPKINKK